MTFYSDYPLYNNTTKYKGSKIMEQIKQKSHFEIIERAGYKTLNILLSFSVGYILSKATINNTISPFSLGVMSVLPFSTLTLIASYIGSVLGYITNEISVETLRFLASLTVLIAIIIISGKKIYRNKVYSPVLISTISILLGVLFMFSSGYSVYSLLIIIFEGVLSGCTSYFSHYFLIALETKSKFETKDIISFNITLLILICALDSYYIYGISIALVFVVTITLYCSYYLQRNIAAFFTLALSFILSLLNPIYDYYILILYIPALISIAISKFDKKYIAISYYMPYITLATLNSSTSLNFHMLLAPLFSIIIYKLTPKEKLKIFLSDYIEVFEPKSHECSNQNSDQLCETYCEMSKELANKINSISITPILSNTTEKQIKKYLYANKCRDINITNYYNTNGKQIITLSYKSVKPVSAHLIRSKISLITGKEFAINTEIKNNDLYKYSLEQIESFKIECYALYKAKKGENVCGDNVSAFKSSNSKYNLILSDGMGSGKEAYNKSFDAITLMKKLLKSNTSPEIAIETVNSSIDMLKDEIGFSTIDLCTISLDSGIAVFLKCGAYISFILRRNNILKINGGGFPAGLNEKVSYTKQTEQLSDGDVIIMMSDGLSEAIDKIQAILLINKHENIEVLTKELLDCAYSNTTSESDDDMTVMCAKIIKRKQE